MAESELVAKSRKQLLKALKHLIVPPLSGHKKFKIINDPIWGSSLYYPWEVAILDTPLFQRLRGIKQTGFAYQTYPTAEHSRFHHTLGVMTAASRIYDSLCERFHGDTLSCNTVSNRDDLEWIIKKKDIWKFKIRLAALVHDLGHSLFSHTSERIISMYDPFPQLKEDLTQESKKRPGTAEIIVYLLVTSDEWLEFISDIWDLCNKAQSNPHPPELSKSDWLQIGNWVCGYEADHTKQFLAEILSGPLDADKLDYIARDAYFAGIPVGHDYERYVSLICLDQQNAGIRLTIPIKGINALEQLVLARLALTSYLYHHQKVRAAESWFERQLAYEIESGDENKRFNKDNIWNMFSMEDSELYEKARMEKNTEWSKLHFRQLPVRFIEFRQRDLRNCDSESADLGYDELLGFTNSGKIHHYTKLLEIEKRIADKLGVDQTSVIIDVPRNPTYDDLQNLKLPGRRPGDQLYARDAIIYDKWLQAYKAHRSYVRIYAPRDTNPSSLWLEINQELQNLGLELSDESRTRV